MWQKQAPVDAALEHSVNVQKNGEEDEEEQVLSVLLSKGATEAALTDEMGRLRVQEEVLGMQSSFLLAANSCVLHATPSL